MKKTSNEKVRECIETLGQNIIDRAKDISNDIERVNQIKITCELNPGEVVSFKVEKSYHTTPLCSVFTGKKEEENGEDKM